MPNTRSAAKRDRLADKRQARNKIIKSATKTALNKVIEAIQSKEKDIEVVKAKYIGAVKQISKAVSKGVIPAARASRKIKRLTHLTISVLPEALPFPVKKKSAAKTKSSS